jgi:exosome complex RNA-binding protein Csl4
MLENILFFADGARVRPGQQLARSAPGLTFGAGIYQKDSFLFAGTVGFLSVEKMAEIDPSTSATD